MGRINKSEFLNIIHGETLMKFGDFCKRLGAAVGGVVLTAACVVGVVVTAVTVVTIVGLMPGMLMATVLSAGVDKACECFRYAATGKWPDREEPTSHARYGTAPA